jgi:hypothetical protein
MGPALSWTQRERRSCGVVVLPNSDLRIVQGNYMAKEGRSRGKGLFDRALDLVSQCLRGGLFGSLCLHLLGGVDCSPSLDILFPGSPYCWKVSLMFFWVWRRVG